MDNELNPEQFLKHKGIYKKVVEDYNPAIVMNLMEEYAVAKFHEQEKNLNIDIVSCSALDDLKKQLEIEKQGKEDNRDNMFISTYQDGKVEATKKAIDILEGYCN